MLTAFLTSAAGGEHDDRLDIRPGLQACRLIDQTRAKYHAALVPWLGTRLARGGAVDEHLRYALTELLQHDGQLSTEELGTQIQRVIAGLRGASGTRWLYELAGGTDIRALLRSTAI